MPNNKCSALRIEGRYTYNEGAADVSDSCGKKAKEIDIFESRCALQGQLVHCAETRSRADIGGITADSPQLALKLAYVDSSVSELFTKSSFRVAYAKH